MNEKTVKEWIKKADHSHILTGYAVEVRYPGEFPEPSLEETKEAIEIAEKVRNFVLKKFKEKGINF